ncbi:MAG: tyrosine-type recombinase/integrase [Lachnospiraceae bacterium]|nr:tyrosine-type recombinase/integrase [Lachnospiraceae bacterium]
MEELLRQFDSYIDKELGKSPNTRISYVRDLRLMFSWLSKKGISSIEEIGLEELQAYIRHLGSKHRSNATISRCVASIRQFFAFALASKYVFNDPSVQLKAPKVIRKAPKIAEDSDIERLLKQPETTSLKGMRDRAMLEMMLSTGMRVSELIGLRTEDVDLKKRAVRVKGSGGRERTVTYRKDISGIIQDYYLITRPQLIVDKPDDGTFFVSCQGEKMTRQGFWKILKGYGKKAQLKEEITPYTLRHSYAVYALKNGEDIHKVQSALGHSAIYFTNEYTSLI